MQYEGSVETEKEVAVTGIEVIPGLGDESVFCDIRRIAQMELEHQICHFPIDANGKRIKCGDRFNGVGEVIVFRGNGNMPTDPVASSKADRKMVSRVFRTQ